MLPVRSTRPVSCRYLGAERPPVGVLSLYVCLLLFVRRIPLGPLKEPVVPVLISSCCLRRISYVGVYDESGDNPLLATSHNPEASQYYTHIPRHSRPRRLDAILVRQQIPNIPWTYYNVIRMPISDHSLVLIGLRWRTGGHTTTGPKPGPNVKCWYTSHFKNFKTNMANMAPPDTDPL